MGRSGAKEQYAAEVDSMLSDARVREDTTMLFALLNVRAKMTMNSERDLAKALVFREQALRPMSLS